MREQGVGELGNRIKCYLEKDGLLLLSDNQEYAPIHATLEDYPNLHIFGVPVGFTCMCKDDPLKKIKKGFH